MHDELESNLYPNNYMPPVFFSINKTFFDIQTMLENRKAPIKVHVDTLTADRVLAVRTMLESYGNSTTYDGEGNYFTVSPF